MNAIPTSAGISVGQPFLDVSAKLALECSGGVEEDGGRAICTAETLRFTLIAEISDGTETYYDKQIPAKAFSTAFKDQMIVEIVRVANPTP